MQYLALVVEDDVALRLIFRRVLSEAGFHTLEAGDGREAIELLQHHTPHLVFLDMLLPEINGEAVLNYLNSAPHLATTYVTLISSNHRFEQLIHHLPGREFIHKPVRPAQIRQIAHHITEAMV